MSKESPGRACGGKLHAPGGLRRSTKCSIDNAQQRRTLGVAATALDKVRTQKRQRGYTILELMISLVLLATLSMVAWSILETYRGAEQRAWNQAYQMQTIRVARQWLQADATCLMEPRVASSSSDLSSLSSSSSSSSSSLTGLKSFRGHAQGFQVDIIPSLNPLAWLNEVTRGEEPLSTTTPAPELAAENTATAIDPLAVHHLQYKLVPGPVTTKSDDEFFDLQRKLDPIDRWSKASSSSPSEKLLTTEDLYRVDEDEMPRDSTTTRKSSTTSIRNLIDPQFRYSDGKEWVGQWDSQLKGSLPRAIELSFDLPSASTDYERLPADPTEASEFGTEELSSDMPPSENLVTLDAPVASVDDEAALQRDVRIVVLVEGSFLSPTSR